ncbi:amidohydrolase [Naasia sp. SYSU D00057]|uniref:amidohydrolase family protein n=1 Tax=Naasia sp. SYSU D00057 TaxID=2817380 RepID=UPI001B3034AF|nr:amidohydrolase family protein [Naasia sp. SYSU D00057]
MPLRIDAHAHVFAPAAESPRGVDDLAPPERAASIADYRARLAAEGIDGAVLVPLDAHDEYVAGVLPELPPTFAAVAVASPAEQGRTDADPVAALVRRRERFPFRALRTMWLGEPGKSLRESPMWPVLQHLEAEGLALWSYLPPDQAGHLDELGTLLPDLAVVLNHLGFAPHDMRVDEHRRPRFPDPLPEAELRRIEALAGHPRFLLMFSGHYALSAEAYPYPDLHAAGRRLVSAFGPERTLWGSDSPWIDDEPGYGATSLIVELALPDLSPAERDAVLGGTAARLLSLSP